MLSLGKGGLTKYRADLDKEYEEILDTLTEEEIKSDEEWLRQELQYYCKKISVDRPEITKLPYYTDYVPEIDDLNLDLLKLYLHHKSIKPLDPPPGTSDKLNEIDEVLNELFIGCLSDALDEADKDPSRGPEEIERACRNIPVVNKSDMKKICIAITVLLDNN